MTRKAHTTNGVPVVMRDRGITLVEVVLTITILAVVTAAVATSITVVLRNERTAVQATNGAQALRQLVVHLPADVGSTKSADLRTSDFWPECREGVDPGDIRFQARHTRVDGAVVTVTYHVADGERSRPDTQTLLRRECVAVPGEPVVVTPDRTMSVDMTAAEFSIDAASSQVTARVVGIGDERTVTATPFDANAPGPATTAPPTTTTPAVPVNELCPLTLVGSQANQVDGGDLTISQPAGTAVGDLLLAVVHIENNAAEFLGDVSGTWATILTREAGSNLGMRSFHRFATSTSASYTWDTSGKKASGGIVALRCDTRVQPRFDADATSGSSGTMSSPSVSASSNDAILLAFFGSKKGSATHSAPTGMTNLYSTANADFRSATHRQVIGAGSTGTRTSGSSDGDSWIGMSVAVWAEAP
jgi:Tfp pilus assembly protein PilV